MGILNVTPDSFSDGGKYIAIDKAVERGIEMAKTGADIIDVGGESTRPGAEAISAEDEMLRVVPVIKALAEKTEAVLSVDTTKSSVAASAVEAGAHIINDVSAMTFDDNMVSVAADSGVGVVLMHMSGTPRTMQKNPYYENVVEDIRTYLNEKCESVMSAGVDRKCIAIDPGIGFGKTLSHNVALLAQLNRIVSLKYPVLIGLSRKGFLGQLTGQSVEARLSGSLAGLACSVMNGAHVMRVHDVEESRDAIKVVSAIRDG
ncbi:dihydropteroate synthase [PVC group bacterium]|nr:dihydropteroate synthase [PVC group bacterium]